MKFHSTSFALEHLEDRDLLAGVPLLHSLPSSPHKLYLDFDGQDVSGTRWNSDEFEVIHAPPFNVDSVEYDEQGKPTFSADEVSRIVSIWERITEDFRPFNLDVTTEDPSLVEPDIFTVGSRAQRILFTSKFDSGPGGTGAQWFTANTLGRATDTWHVAADVPAWVFSTHAIGGGEIGSHEAGHTFDLHHDGYVSDTGEFFQYRQEHGSGETTWSPIMGAGNVLSQWSKGEYPNATNTTQDDIGILTRTLGRRPDDYDSIAEISVVDSVIDVEGIIESSFDSDTFRLDVSQPNSRLSIDILPWHNGANLDIKVSLYELSTSSVVVEFGDRAVNPVDKLASSIDVTVQPGTYFLIVDGDSKEPVPGDPGYSDYGSLGYYHILGSLSPTPALVGDINQDGVLTSADIDALHAAFGKSPTTWLDLNNDQLVNHDDVDVLVQQVFNSTYGDLDLDGDVDFSDFLQLAANFGKQDAGWSMGDATGDGNVLFPDFLALSANFGFDNKESAAKTELS